MNVGNYRLGAAIGEGGMGTVYRAVHEALGRAAAVKLLLPEVSTSRDAVTRFFNEARAAASIQDVGIVDVYDFGFLPDGRAYIIMELLAGESLASRLRRERPPPVRALQIVRSVARALHAAHERGIVHRDIKPDNIFLVPDPELPAGERIKLLDFGIAKLVGDGAAASLTRTGDVIGTPTYMAPEQCRGTGVIDRRADLYALGCILYEMLCGRPPFIAAGAGDVLAHHLYFRPEPPRAHDASIAPEVEALILSLLEKEPARRPPTALAVVEAIDRLGGSAAGAATAGAGARPGARTEARPAASSSAASLTARTGSSRRRWIRGVAGATVTAAAAVAVAAVVAGSRGSERGPEAAAQRAQVAPAPIAAAPTAVAPTEAASPEPAPATPSPPGQPAPAPATSPEPAPAPAPSATTPAPSAITPSARPAPPSSTNRPSSPSPEVSPTCTRSSFAPVLQAKQPAEAAVQAALVRLKQCQKVLPPRVYADLQQRLVEKL